MGSCSLTPGNASIIIYSMPDTLTQINTSAYSRIRLCQPLKEPASTEILYKKSFAGKNCVISLRLLSIKKDIELIYNWVNQEYAKRFWQMDGRPIDQLKETYQYIMLSDFAQSYLALLDNVPICQLDVYHALQDEVSLFYNAQEGDYGVHLLMAPNKKKISNLTIHVFQTFLEYFFSHSEVKRIVGEPDAANMNANKLVKTLGFQFQHKIAMSYKTANFYTCTRDNFHAAINTPETHTNG